MQVGNLDSVGICLKFIYSVNKNAFNFSVTRLTDAGVLKIIDQRVAEGSRKETLRIRLGFVVT